MEFKEIGLEKYYYSGKSGGLRSYAYSIR